MIPESQANLSTNVEFLAKDELSTFDPEVFPRERIVEKLKSREVLFKAYVDVRKLALVASGLGENGFTKF